ncbi:hypothetical protein B0H67DRAFT_640358 [Lasiosphaeris hirsuta]|uniref:Uncharacterized protein n=1 Tax=Lasiosphaeris hirsuta TaxID=260670 RepID=A0AA40EE71_9PEZI|nr:hypothetical protein B0H67DRAFT_640358 [Lasiosphaeris hirsuta]
MPASASASAILKSLKQGLKNGSPLDKAQSKTTKQKERSSASKGSNYKESSDIFNKLPIETLMGLPQETLANLPPETLTRLPLETLAQLPTSVIAKLPPETLAQLPPERISALPISALAKLPLETLSTISPHLLLQLPPSLLLALPPSLFATLSPTDLSRLPPELQKKVIVNQVADAHLSRPLQPPTAIFTDSEPAQDSQKARGWPNLSFRNGPQRSEEPKWDHSKPRQSPDGRDSIQTAPYRSSSQRGLRLESDHDDSGVRRASTLSKTGHGLVQGRQGHPVSPAPVRTASGPFQSAPTSPNVDLEPPSKSVRLNAQDYHMWGQQTAKIAPDQGPRVGGVSNGKEERPTSVVNKIGHSKRVSMGSRSKQGAELPLEPHPEFSLERHRDDSTTSLAPKDHQTAQIQANQVEELQAKLREDRQKHADRLRLADREVEEARKTLQQYQWRANKMEQDLMAAHQELDMRTSALHEKTHKLEEMNQALGQMKKDQEAMDKNLERRDREIYMGLSELDQTKRQLVEVAARETALSQELAAALQASDANIAKHKQEIAELSRTHQQALERQAFGFREQEKALTTDIEVSYEERIKGLKYENDAGLSEMRGQLDKQAEGIKAREGKVQKLKDAIREREAEIEKVRDEFKKLDEYYRKTLIDLEADSQSKLQKVSNLSAAKSQQHQLELAKLRAAHDAQIRALQESHQTTLGEYHASTDAKLTSLSAERDQLLADHATELYAISEQFSAQVQQEREDRTAELRHQQDSYENLLYRERDEHARALAALRPEPGEQIRQAADHDLRGSYRDLQLMVQTITQPFNLGKLRLPGTVGGRGIDPTGFVEREGKGAVRHLLSSVVWARIVDGFFSAPCGFGAFGNGEGAGLLMDVFRGWMRLLAPAEDPIPDPDLELFRTDQAANRWRSATFHSIVCSIKSASESSSQDDEAQQAQTLVTPFTANQAKVKAQILDVLREVTQNPLLEEIEDKVGDIVSVAGALALEIGVHRAFLGLAVPQRGEQVQIGHEFIDCEDGDAARGAFETVDLVVSPHLFRVGDGRGDLTTTKAIHPGEIYPVRS